MIDFIVWSSHNVLQMLEKQTLNMSTFTYSCAQIAGNQDPEQTQNHLKSQSTRGIWPALVRHHEQWMLE
jgi:hypothetical protein